MSTIITDLTKSSGLLVDYLSIISCALFPQYVGYSTWYTHALGVAFQSGNKVSNQAKGEFFLIFFILTIADGNYKNIFKGKKYRIVLSELINK